MTQEEKLILRIASLDDGLTTVRFFKKNGELVMWFVVDTLKPEGERGKIEERKEV